MNRLPKYLALRFLTQRFYVLRGVPLLILRLSFAGQQDPLARFKPSIIHPVRLHSLRHCRAPAHQWHEATALVPASTLFSRTRNSMKTLDRRHGLSFDLLPPATYYELNGSLDAHFGS